MKEQDRSIVRMNKRGVLGLDTVRSAFIMVLILGIMAFAIIVFLGTADDLDVLEGTESDFGSDILRLFNGSQGDLSQSASTVGVGANNQTFLRFDGDSDFIGNITGARPINVTLNRTYSVWFNASGETQTTDFILMLNDTIETLGRVNETIRYTIRNTSNTVTTLTFSTAINNSLWHHVGVQVFGELGNATLYVDGAVANSSITGVLNPPVMALNISFPNATRSWNGDLDEVRIYNTTLTSAQINEIRLGLRTSNASLPSAGLVAWYSFNTNNGNTVFDSSQHRLNTSIGAGTTWVTDGIEIQVPNSSYIQSGSRINLTDINFHQDQLNVSYNFTVTTNDFKATSGNITSGIGVFFENFGTIMSILVAVVIILAIVLIIVAVQRFGGGGSVGAGGGGLPGSGSGRLSGGI